MGECLFPSSGQRRLKCVTVHPSLTRRNIPWKLGYRGLKATAKLMTTLRVDAGQTHLDVTSNFWFTKGSGRLEAGKQIRWDWEMYNHSVEVSVKAIEGNKRILIEWGAEGKPTTTVEWVFTSRPDSNTLVSVTNTGFSGDGDEIVKQALDSTGGFTLVLAGAKAFLEHKTNLNLIADRFPDQIVKD